MKKYVDVTTTTNRLPVAIISGGGWPEDIVLGLKVKIDGTIAGLDDAASHPDAAWRRIRFTSMPTILISNPLNGSARATATLTAVPRTLASLRITNPGDGYSAPPPVVITDAPGGTGTGAMGRGLIHGDKTFGNAITMESPGIGYLPEATATVGIPWKSGETYAVGDYINSSLKLYRVTTAGDSGNNAPTHDSGNASTIYNYVCVAPELKPVIRLGGIKSVTVGNGGSGYKPDEPIVEIFGGGGSGAKAVAQVSGGAIVGITLEDDGTGYISAPLVSIRSTTGRGADVTASINPPGLIDIIVINPGYGYTQPPRISFSDGGGVGAEASCLLSSGKSITGYLVTYSGDGYVASPKINVASTSDYSSSIPDPSPNCPRVTALVAGGRVFNVKALSAGGLYTTSPQVIVEDPPVGYSSMLDIDNAALASTLSTSASFIDLDAEVEIRVPSPVINATSMVAGRSYVIETLGTTVFTTLGANSDILGTVFTATYATGTSSFSAAGTGTVKLQKYDTVFSTSTFTFRVHNDVTKGTETTPT